MQLPGGLIEGGKRQRQYRFQPVSGSLELALTETAALAASTPEAVTRILALALRELGGQPMSEERAASLCVADRQFLMRELERYLGFSGGWFHADCTACAARFDFHLDYAELPVQEAGAGYPWATVEHQGRTLRFRLPTGRDQEGLTRIPDDRARGWLLQRLACDPAPLDEVDGSLVDSVEAALERVAPAVVVQVQACCPECGANTAVDLDPYRVVRRQSDNLLAQVHRIALHYHWSEAEILGLPHSRRQRYLEMIDHSRGMVS
ncbi:hypothetical protein Despr_3274 [Desulfobulbus propionicus DSM 2032]|jgi:hypothetical protein|uniref:Uncharacterized protein n=1 Tax=Desulfobulbus propionicus (strain ATCC 33891 / DSM 2032 / VKM B-1956 / 1pr3) TaxID=577650 RepID=A0A7U3YQ97_DESPD|nr:hypothetical protein [Desulfobulbus propionicus]ADW19401.1 hypothetical protein Despr_3274 [Desulfobulbus propionicus DSM 2032]